MTHRAPRRAPVLALPALATLLFTTAAFRCPGPEPAAAPGSGGGGGDPATSSSTSTQGGGGDPSTTTSTSSSGGGGEGGGPDCLDTQFDVNNCGACGRVCSTFGILQTTCVQGFCTPTQCEEGRLDVQQPAAPADDDGCEAIEHRVFVTNGSHFPDWGGTAGADAICQAAADAELLGGVWMAWVSDTASSPAVRFAQDGGPYKRSSDETVIADDWADLTDGTLDAAILFTETGSMAEASVWTGTAADGTPIGGSPCSDWTSGQGEARFGYTSSADLTWTSAESIGCDGNRRLYCFEQEK